MTLIKLFVVVLYLFTGYFLTESASADSSRLNGQNGKQVLLKMAHAMAVLNYRGTVAFLRNGRLEPMKYFHAAKNGREQEHLLSLNSPLREITRDADKVSCLFKATQQVIVDRRPYEHSFLLDIPENLDQLDAVYDIQLAGEEEIAMLPAYVIAIEPKDNFRYAKKIWIEKQQFLPLKVVVYNVSGEVLEQLVFTDLEVKDNLPFIETNFPDNTTKSEETRKSQAISSEQAVFTVANLPQEFREIFFTRKPLHNSTQPVDHMLLSDGFAAVSIYSEHKSISIPSDSQPKAIQSIGAINFLSRTIDNFEFTVMGEVPVETVKFIAEGIRLRSTKE